MSNDKKDKIKNFKDFLVVFKNSSLDQTIQVVSSQEDNISENLGEKILNFLKGFDQIRNYIGTAINQKFPKDINAAESVIKEIILFPYELTLGEEKRTTPGKKLSAGASQVITGSLMQEKSPEMYGYQLKAYENLGITKSAVDQNQQSAFERTFEEQEHVGRGRVTAKSTLWKKAEPRSQEYPKNKEPSQDANKNQLGSKQDANKNHLEPKQDANNNNLESKQDANKNQLEPKQDANKNQLGSKQDANKNHLEPKQDANKNQLEAKQDANKPKPKTSAWVNTKPRGVESYQDEKNKANPSTVVSQTTTTQPEQQQKNKT